MKANVVTATGEDSVLLDWRGFGEIWTAQSYHLHLRRSFTLAIDKLAIEAQSPKKKIRIPISEIVEVRSFRFPIPSLTLVFKDGDSHGLVSLFCFSQQRCLKLTELSGIAITDRRTWRTGLEAGRDQKQYGLQGGS